MDGVLCLCAGTTWLVSNNKARSIFRMLLLSVVARAKKLGGMGHGLAGSKITPKELFVPLHKDAIPNSVIGCNVSSSALNRGYLLITMFR
jgi:hypothetical protein